jgi:hypothetical protein
MIYLLVEKGINCGECEEESLKIHCGSTDKAKIERLLQENNSNNDRLEREYNEWIKQKDLWCESTMKAYREYLEANRHLIKTPFSENFRKIQNWKDGCIGNLVTQHYEECQKSYKNERTVSSYYCRFTGEPFIVDDCPVSLWEEDKRVFLEIIEVEEI